MLNVLARSRRRVAAALASAVMAGEGHLVGPQIRIDQRVVQAGPAAASI